jgi:hypothetical protein
MLVPLTRSTLEEIIPLIATGNQYAYYWGSLSNLLKQLLISVVSFLLILLLGTVIGQRVGGLKIILAIVAGLYWLWSPVYWASLRNASYRRFPYAGFLRGKVIDVFVTDEVVREQQGVNRLGELVVVENRERMINLEIGDRTGFRIIIQAPLRRIHKIIRPGAIAELVVLSKQANLGTIAKFTDVYLPQYNLWVGEYPYLRRDVFLEISEKI